MTEARQKRVLITGITGFAGSHLAEHCLRCGLRVCGLTRKSRAAENLKRIRHEVELIEGDLADEQLVEHMLKEVRPHLIFHLAGQTFYQSQGSQLLNTNILGTLNLLEGCAKLMPAPLVHIASSSAVYGGTDRPLEAVTETTPLNPIDAYGLSKATQDLLAGWFHRSHGLPIVRTRAFNHTGPREREEFICSTIAKQIAEIEQGLCPPRISIGNVETERDFSDVRDIVRGYYLALQRGQPGEIYNLASGQALSIASILQRLMDISDVRAEVVQDPGRMRTSDVPCQIGDYSKAKRQLGWNPEILFDQSLRDLLDYWRQKISTRIVKTDVSKR